MKRKDLLVIIAVAMASLILAAVVSNLLFSTSEKAQKKVYVVDVISDDFSSVDERYFNANSIDPTKLIRIGDSENPEPFKEFESPSIFGR